MPDVDTAMSPPSSHPLARHWRALPAYWRLQLPGLALAFIAGLFYTTAFYGLNSKAVAMGVWSVAMAAVTCEVLHAIYRRRNARGGGDLAQFLRVIVACVPAGAITAALGAGFDIALGLEVPGGHTWTRFMMGVFIMGLFYASWSLLYFGLKHRQAERDARERLREVQLLATQAELAMLRYQLTPHFLFNALTSLRQLIVEAPDKARVMTGELAGYLRHALCENATQDTTLGDELIAIERYLALEKIRFEERIDVRIHADAVARTWSVPTFLLQPLVENAFKHGACGSDAEPLRLDIQARADADQLAIIIRNSGHWQPSKQADSGMGLANLRRRLQAQYPDRHDFDIGPDTDAAGQVRARIVLRASAIT